MRRRIVLAAILELVLIALVAGMFAFSIHMAGQERAWREQGARLSSSEQVAVDVSMWWLKYWWAATPFLVLGGLGLAAVTLFSGRSAPPGRAAAAL